MTIETPPTRRRFTLQNVQPTLQMLIMLAFTLALVAVIALAGYLLPEAVTGAVTVP